MLTFHVATYVFHTYLNPWLRVSGIGFLLSPLGRFC
nr:MAG TPA: hypothetical protein [Caudoviricetes sp.]DAS07221.1 MAG TPA: hypothetical protein [Caudoviricetes sp.]